MVEKFPVKDVDWVGHPIAAAKARRDAITRIVPELHRIQTAETPPELDKDPTKHIADLVDNCVRFGITPEYLRGLRESEAPLTDLHQTIEPLRKAFLKNSNRD